METSMLDRLEEIVKVDQPDSKAPASIDAKCFAEKVEKMAYQLYERRGCRQGRDWQDWFDAEKLVEDELIAQR